MATVDTVRGAVDTASLGQVLMHEHVFVLDPDIMQNYGSDYWNEQEQVTDAIRKLRELKAAGIDTIVDLTVLGVGRFLPRIQRVNAEVDLNIIVATGFYTWDQLPLYFYPQGPGTLFGGPEPLVEFFVRDITSGIGDTGVKAATLKCVVEERGLTPDQTRVAKAVAAAHRETGTPITVHTNSAHQTGRLALEFFRAEGVDLTKVVIGHAGDSTDLDYLRWIADQGAIIGCDRFGLDVFNPTADRIAAVAALCAEGYADRIVLSHDAACFMDLFSAPHIRQQVTRALPDWNYLHIPTTVVPALREAGVTDAQLHEMLVAVPRRYFEKTG
ncbi:MAG: phosphotriesterase-related protein [Actinomycetota bacterium]|nr:phosphotriesterase-related protein [Actinomycetota bacterium]